MNQASEKRLQRLHPQLASAIRKAVDDLAARNLVFEVVQGLRTFAEQDALYAQGRTAPGPIVTQAKGGESNHNYGLAADLCPFVDGRPDWNAPIKVWAALGAAAEARGLEWGGSWKKFLDKPHVQLPTMTVAECQRCYTDGGLDAVWLKATTRLAADGGSRGLRRTLTGAPSRPATKTRAGSGKRKAAAKPKPKPRRAATVRSRRTGAKRKTGKHTRRRS